MDYHPCPPHDRDLTNVSSREILERLQAMGAIRRSLRLGDIDIVEASIRTREVCDPGYDLPGPCIYCLGEGCEECSGSGFAGGRG